MVTVLLFPSTLIEYPLVPEPTESSLIVKSVVNKTVNISFDVKLII